MSKLADYSKFDKLDDGSSEEEETSKPAPRPVAASPSGPSMRKNPKNGRFVYEYNGQAIYEWEQSMEEVILYIPAPPVPSNQIHCKILPHRLQLGVAQLVQKQGKYFIDEDTFGTVEVSESTWTREDGMLVIYLAKASKGQVWELALKGNQAAAAAELDPISKQQVQKEMMLERFQEENPGMDFRGAEFNGNVPDPRTFMGGVKYS